MAKDFIHFFGTTGDKGIFFKKIRSAGGYYCCIDGTTIVIDPGPTTLYKYINSYDDKIDGIVLSHIHIDHSNDLNILVELMTEGGASKRGTLLLPKQAIDEKVLFPYLREFPENLQVIQPNSNYKIKNIEITSSAGHRHGVENYGFILKTKNHVIGFVTDTAYFPELLASYQNCEILIMNVPYYKQDKPKPKHLDIANAEELIQAIKPKKVILTHFGCDLLNHNPDKIAEDLSQKYGMDVTAAQDDMILEL